MNAYFLILPPGPSAPPRPCPRGALARERAEDEVALEGAALARLVHEARAQRAYELVLAREGRARGEIGGRGGGCEVLRCVREEPGVCGGKRYASVQGHGEAAEGCREHALVTTTRL
jgi:hypothetical protein